MGVCKVALGHYAEAKDLLLAVPANHDAPELCAFAMVEAAHSLSRMNEPEQAKKLLLRVVRAYPKSTWAKLAEQRLKTPSETPPHELAVAATLLAPDSSQPPLEMLGQQQSVRSTLDDAAEEAYQSAILSRKPPERFASAPFIRLTLPDPFEHQQLLSLSIERAAERLPSE
jgi:hypothetical protein